MLYLISLMRPDIAAGADEPEILTLTREAMAGGDFSLAGVARRLGYSPEYLSRRFHKDASLTFQRFALETRLRRATELLFDEGKSIPETAEALGYADQSSFARAFRARYGLSPSEFGRLRSPLGK